MRELWWEARVFDSVGWGEILVLLVAGLFILGPERLPEAAAWLGKTIRQVKDFATGARDQLRSEIGPEFDELRKPLDDLRQPLRELRSLRDPKRAMMRSLLDDDQPTKPQSASPAPAPPARPLAPNERPPIDPDAT